MTTLIGLDAFLARALERRDTTLAGRSRPARSVAAALTLARECNANILIRHFFAPAYLHDADVIIIPPQLYRLVRRPKYLSTVILHELIHWSGAAARMNRPLHTQPFDAVYNREELTAEIGAVLLSFDLGISRRPILPNHRYLASFLATLDRPEVALRVALGQAEQAAAYLHATAKGT